MLEVICDVLCLSTSRLWATRIYAAARIEEVLATWTWAAAAQKIRTAEPLAPPALNHTTARICRRRPSPHDELG